MRAKDYRLAYLTFDKKRNILYFRVKQDIVIERTEFNELMGYVEDFMGEVAHYAITDFGGTLLSSTESRQAYATSDYIKKYRLADAILVNSLPTRILINFFVNVVKPEVKTRLFSNKSSAILWLETLADEAKVKIGK